jgi:hypothetical protein
MNNLVGNGIGLLLSNAFDAGKFLWVACYQSAFAQEVMDVLEVILLGKLVHVSEHLLLSHVAERVLDSGDSCQYSMWGSCGAFDVLGRDAVVNCGNALLLGNAAMG